MSICQLLSLRLSSIDVGEMSLALGKQALRAG